MFKFPIQLTHIAGPLILALCSTFFWSLDGQLHEILRYDREMLQSAEIWRLFSGHLLHTNSVHLGLNLVGILLLWAIHGHYYHLYQFSLMVLSLMLLTSVGLYYFDPALQWYVGLSGILHGLFVWGAIRDIQHGLRSGWLLLLGVSVKIGYEIWFGASAELAGMINAQVAVLSHLSGALAGCCIVIIEKLIPPIRRAIH